jgi:hypothetical protein
MFHSGQYPQPNTRVSFFRAAVVAGYTTARLFTPDAAVSVSGYERYQTRILLKNEGADTATIQLVETNDYVSGPRTNVGGAITLVPKGEKIQTFNPTKSYLELQATSGTSFIHAQLESVAEWNLMAFDKAETIFPPFLNKKWPDPSPPPGNGV